VLAVLLLLLTSAAPAAAQVLVAHDLKRLTLEELMLVEVATALRVPEPVMTMPAAVAVITEDEIRRSGATSLPEVLRLAPGVHVARIDAARYAIGIRGFGDRLSRSMLVLMDGRAVYSPLFAGTYWEVQETLLEDVERIEIVRGPGGTLWGANAVNGIINIVTKRAEDTQGVLGVATIGTDLQGPIGIRYGGRAGSRGHYRVYAKGVDRDAQVHAAGPAFGTLGIVQGGFRADWSLARERSLTVQGDAYAAELAQRYDRPLTGAPFEETIVREAPLYGGNALARLAGPLFGGAFQLQTYYDRTRRDERPVAETRDTFDVDFQHRRALGRHQLVWGAGYRVSRGRITAVEPSRFSPPERTDHLFTAFAQNDLVIAPDRLRLIGGAKLEHNAYTGFELQPAARLLWTPAPAHAAWLAATHAVRTPSRVETDYGTTSLVSPETPTFVRLQPNPDFEAETLTAYEAGYRVRPVPSLFVSTALFFNHHDETLSTELGTPFVEGSPARLILPVTFRNGVHGNSHGVEVAADWRPAPWWRWTADYAFLRVQMTRDAGSTDVSQEGRYERLAPRHQAQVGTSIDLPRRVFLDWRLRYVSELRLGPVPAYATSNVRVAWQPVPRLEIAVVGQNLHEPRHLEWPSDGPGVFLRRRAYVGLTWRP
jgi:iron complex outermembrane receptor protein